LLLSAAFSFVVYWRVKRDGFPFLLCGVFLVIEAAAIRFGTDFTHLSSAFKASATVPEWLTVSIGFTLGAATAWAGWNAPHRQGPSPQPLPA
jgi:hypothetical protein